MSILDNYTNPQLAFVNNEVYLDPSAEDWLVGVYVDVPSLNSPWTFSFFFPVVPLAIPAGELPIPIGNIGVTGSITMVPQEHQVCGSAGAGVQLPYAGRSWSVGPIMTGNVDRAASVASGPSNNYNVNLPLPVPVGWQYGTNSSGSIGGPTIGAPGASYSWTSGGCGTIP